MSIKLYTGRMGSGMTYNSNEIGKGMRDNTGEEKQDWAEYVLSGRHERDVFKRAREIAKERGEAFIVFVGNLLSPGTGFRAESAYKDLWLAKQVARDHVGCGTPRASVKIRRIRV